MLARIIDWISIVFLIFATVFAILVDFQPLYPSSTPLIKQIDKLFCDNYKSTLLCYNTAMATSNAVHRTSIRIPNESTRYIRDVVEEILG